MNPSASKENILKKIRQALSTPVPEPFLEQDREVKIFPAPADDETVVFAETFTALQGKFALCESQENLALQMQHLLQSKNWTKVYCADERIKQMCGLVNTHPTLHDCDVSITGCEYLIARTGSMVLSSNHPHGRTASVYAPIHICVAFNYQLVYDLKDALYFLKEKYGHELPSFISFASGPSRTADIEKTLVTGVHGPKEVYCFLIDG